MAHQSSGESAFEGGSSSSSSTQRLLEDIASAIHRDHGIGIVVSSIAQAFDHHQSELHDSNIEAGAVTALLYALDHVTRKVKVSQSPLGSTNEAKTLMIAAAAGISALQMTITRCSDVALEYCVRRNCNDLLPSLATLLTIFGAGDNQSSVIRQLLLKHTTGSLATVSRSNLSDIEIDPSAIKQCCSALVGTLQNEGPGPIRSNCIAILSTFSSIDLVRDTMIRTTGLLDTFIALIRSSAVASRSDTEVILSVLHNLSSSRGNGIMEGNEELQVQLIRLMKESSSSTILCTAAQTLQSIICGTDKPVLFCSEDELINGLVMGVEDGSGASSQAACTSLLEHLVKNFAISAKSTNRPDLVLAISNLALKGSTDAATLLPELSRLFILDESVSSSKVLANLIDLSRADYPDPPSLHASEALRNLSRTEENAHFLTSHTDGPRLFSCLASLASSGSAIHCEYALESIYNLCACTKGTSRYVICRDSNVSGLFLGIMSGKVEVSDEGYAFCVKAIKCLASHPPNQKRMSKYRSIVPTLIAFAAKGLCSSDTKEAAIDAIVLLSRTAILV